MELNHLSIYQNDRPSTKAEIKQACATLSINFTDQTDGFWTELIKALVEEKVGYRWLTEMTSHTLRFYPYHRLCIFDTLKYDKLIHTLTWAELDEMLKAGRQAELGLLADGDHEWVVLKAEVTPYGFRVRDFKGYNYSYPPEYAL